MQRLPRRFGDVVEHSAAQCQHEGDASASTESVSGESQGFAAYLHSLLLEGNHSVFDRVNFGQVGPRVVGRVPIVIQAAKQKVQGEPEGNESAR